jgi:hypothetical protein
VSSRYCIIVIGGTASATAFVAALMGYAFWHEQNLPAAGLHFLATFAMTAIALTVAGWLDRPEKADENRVGLPAVETWLCAVC